MATPFSLTKDVIKMQFATNQVGHFLLTDIQGRIANVLSEGHWFAYKEGIWLAKLNDEEEYNTIAAYGQSKLASILHANELARRFKVCHVLSKCFFLFNVRRKHSVHRLTFPKVLIYKIHIYLLILIQRNAILLSFSLCARLMQQHTNGLGL
ncbi:short-chain dehydrogenase TIC 32, chloroplastic-like [Triticum aestivum]|uniref:short-chain dehydrogenase TIC 32, chloroplastic-like n=1 Tax=Triticum aestivum TaxID=4565 RepID=UPI001D008E0D|nr:short-chain dehydrogenase TIC 32, chloroplastic-like [Triticum aestivum]